ncbi:MAG: leucine dehydrogenase, partial [Actinomycetota bacterium]|nr:leucine dehydrogenase [Actinomycetota bacterium]
GAHVLVADVAEEHAQRVAADTGAERVAALDAIQAECDVYSPCAVGGTLSAESIPRLRCRIVAGSANNQLADPSDADRLREAGILYAPDYVISAGGVIQLVGLEDRGWDDDELERHLARIGDTLRDLYRDADAEDITPDAAAQRLAAERIAQVGATEPGVREPGVSMGRAHGISP